LETKGGRKAMSQGRRGASQKLTGKDSETMGDLIVGERREGEAIFGP